MLAAAGTPLLRGQASTFREQMVINGVKVDVAEFRFGTLDPAQLPPDPAPPALDEFTVIFPNKMSPEQVAALDSLKYLHCSLEQRSSLADTPQSGQRWHSAQQVVQFSSLSALHSAR